jgi:hypothetical protein
MVKVIQLYANHPDGTAWYADNGLSGAGAPDTLPRLLLADAWRPALEIRSAQTLTWENKLAKGFNTSDVPLEFCLLQGEIAEAFDAWRRSRENLGEELADIAIYVLSLAEMTGIDLQEAVEQKLAKNAKRSYVQDDASGTLVKVDPA